MVIEVMLHRHQFHRGDPDAVHVVDDHRMRQTGIGPAQLYRNLGMAHRQCPSIALAYGSRSSLAGLQRSPAGGS
jgi:hypothetical protein